MVLEALFSFKSVLNNPKLMFAYAFIVSSVSIWFSFYVFNSFADSVSLLAVAFITIASAPLLRAEFEKLEEEDYLNRKKKSFFERNFWIVKVYTWFFLGIVISYVLWFVVFSNNSTSFCPVQQACLTIPGRENVFSAQKKTLQGISKIKSKLTGEIITQQTPCKKNLFCWFNVIFSNNLSVMLLAVIFSFLYGAGAIFLISWNASVVGISIGESMLMANHLKFLGLLPHGIPELLGYFFAAISGGLLGTVISKKRFYAKEFAFITTDSSKILLLGAFSLFIGAIIEALLIVESDEMAIVLSVLYLFFLFFLIVFSKKK